MILSCGHSNTNSNKEFSSNKSDTIIKQAKDMSDYSPTFEKIHPDAKSLMTEDFYFNHIDETSPFGNDDGADTYAGFKDWRQTHKTSSPKEFLNEQINSWGYPKFDLYETDIEKLRPYLKQSELGSRFMSGIDAAVIAIAFGQLYLEGNIDKDLNKLAKTAITRQLIPQLLNLWGDSYKKERETKLNKMLAVLNKVN